jgi:DNA-binding transcriptional LysR family regulator
MAEDARHALHTCVERQVPLGYVRSVPRPDLNLLVALDVLLAEESVAAAARQLQLSPSAMSRTLARLRASTGDPLLVRAGRALVATPRAKELRDRVGHLVQEGESVLRPPVETEAQPAGIARAFTLRTGEGFVESFGPALLRRVGEEAPRVRLRFLPKLGRDSGLLREGAVDLETGVVGKATGPEVRAQALFRDRFIGVVRAGHPLSRGRVTPTRYAAARHVEVWQHVPGGPVDAALESLEIEREIGVVVGGFASALALVRSTDLVASVPDRHTGSLRAGMRVFALPFAAPEVTVSMLWHPRLDADPAHRWLRRCVREVCAEASGARARARATRA